MVDLLNELQNSLNELVGIYRPLLDVLRMERDALIQVDIKQVREATLSKEMLLANLRVAENRRQILLERLNPENISLEELAVQVQGEFPSEAQHLRSMATALRLLVRRSQEQNAENQSYAEQGLKHLTRMRGTLLGEEDSSQSGYGAKGQRTSNGPQPRVLIQEG